MQLLPDGTCEAIIANDGDEVFDAGEASQWLRSVEGPKRGPAANRNHGAANASGDWLIFIDDDCVPDAGILRAYADAVAPAVHVYEGKTTCLAGIRSALDHAPVNTKGGYLWSCNFMISRDVFLALGSFDEGFPYAAMEDVDLRERLKAAGFEFRFVPGATVDHPPRRIGGIGELQNHYICGAYYTVVKKGARLKLRTVLYATLKSRVRAIITAPDRRDSLSALALLAREVMMIVTQTRKWERRFRHPDGV
jgi:glycosyltransferase involved in cell wall biosynthesis